ncbi:threonine ammonia-lyase [Rhodobacterales bacterium 52_120_T64]|nr:threonine ammonia-lyase [Rhodobacterales bacterium 52_120_T64]
MNIEMINAAAARLAPVVRRTPMLSSPFLDEMAGRRVLVKAESLQHTGSFKFRGGWSALSGMSEAQRANGVIAYSSGNHAQGVALAAAKFGVPAVIVMPEDSPKLKVANTQALGAEVVTYDRLRDSREEIGAQLAAERGLTLVKPYDEPLVIAGQGTIGLEILEQATAEGIETADVLIPCGGGGLTSGISVTFEGTDLRARTCEPEEFDDVARSLASGEREVNATQGGSICDAIVTNSPGEITFPIMLKNCGPGLVVNDEEAMRAVAIAYQRLKIVLEPGGAVALAAALFHADKVEGDAVIVVATGGNVDTDVFTQCLELL